MQYYIQNKRKSIVRNKRFKKNKEDEYVVTSCIRSMGVGTQENC